LKEVQNPMFGRYLGLWQADGAERVNGPVSEKIIKAIKQSGKGWTVSELAEERHFVCI